MDKHSLRKNDASTGRKYEKIPFAFIAKGYTSALIINSLVHHGAPDITQGKTIIAAMIHWSPLHQVQFSAAGGIIAMATTS